VKTVDIAQATSPLAEYVRAAARDPVIVTDEGRPIAAVLSIENADAETVALSTNPTFLALIERSYERWKREGGISTEEMRRRLSDS
jgi:prevent-host-death family protein